jgi:hypothetical protein
MLWILGLIRLKESCNDDDGPVKNMNNTNTDKYFAMSQVTRMKDEILIKRLHINPSKMCQK